MTISEILDTHHPRVPRRAPTARDHCDQSHRTKSPHGPGDPRGARGRVGGCKGRI